MDAFEVIAARFFEVQGFWTRIGVKVEITKPEKVALNNKSMPRPEIDVVAWKLRQTNSSSSSARAISIRPASATNTCTVKTTWRTTNSSSSTVRHCARSL